MIHRNLKHLQTSVKRMVRNNLDATVLEKTAKYYEASDSEIVQIVIWFRMGKSSEIVEFMTDLYLRYYKGLNNGRKRST